VKCPEARQLFSVHLDGELAPAEAEVLGAHLAECKPCAAELELERALTKALRGFAAPRPAPPGFAGGVIAALEARRQGRLARLAAAAGRWRRGLAVAAAFLLIVTASLGYGVPQWLGRTPLVAVDPPDKTGAQVAPPGPGAGPGADVKPESGAPATGGSSGKPGPGEPEAESGPAPGSGEAGKTAAPVENGTDREPERVMIADGPDPEPKVFLNQPRRISSTFLKLNVADLEQARDKAVALAKEHGTPYQAQGAGDGTSTAVLRFDVDPARAEGFVNHLSKLGLVAHRQSDQWEITGQFSAALAEYQALLTRRERTFDPDQRAVLDNEIAALERQLAEWDQDARHHIVVLMLQQEN
jgi:hypothetical protein